MRVLVLGSGVVGVTSAWYLAREGHEVTVIDRQPGAGLETSFANAGQLSYGYSSPWAAPGVPVKAIKWMLSRHSPLVIHPKLDPKQWRFLWQIFANCTERAYALNKGRMVRVADYARDCLLDLKAETGIEFDERSRGTLQVFRKQAQIDHLGDDLKVLDQYGVPYELLDANGCADAEPALALVKEKLVGGLRLPQDGTGDAFLFSQRLAALCAEKGVTFKNGVTIKGLKHDAGRITGVETSIGLLKADRYVVALGSFSPALLAPLGISLPVYPVKGYSLTLPVEDEAGAPVSTVMDESYKIAITRLGDRIRVGGTAELSGFSTDLPEARRRTLAHSVSDLFPRGGDVSKASFWTGLRPMTPDGTPVIGPTRYDNLFLNTGHGTLGWTMSCGSGRLLADLVSGKKPNIEHQDLAISRYAA
ncbi:D-amino acid dehydrogenase [Acetobacteraceae bacterium H6797]|nr:D-amino acid dehydrogenase [Acetobacteraceae bacterium H6797]